MRPKLTYSNVMSTLCFFLLLSGGAAYAASQLGKNSVGTKQLKKNAVTTAKVKNEAITGAKVKKGTLTGAQISASTLGTVPTADRANTADRATTAGEADTLAAPEGWHEVGALGQPMFQNSWKDVGKFAENVGFYKDKGGVVHLKGTAISGTSPVLFQLPAGFRPASEKVVLPVVSCGGGPLCTSGFGNAQIVGPNTFPGEDGAVKAPQEATLIRLEGITFRAES